MVQCPVPEQKSVLCGWRWKSGSIVFVQAACWLLVEEGSSVYVRRY